MCNLSLVAANVGHSPFVVLGLVFAVPPVVIEHGFYSMWALVVMQHGFSCPVACGVPTSPALSVGGGLSW